MNVITACFFILLNSNVLLNGAETDLEKHGYTKNKQGLRNAFKYSIQSKNHSLFSSVFIYSECKDIVFLDKDEAWSYICGEEFVNKFNISYCSYYLVRNYINELRNDELRDIYTNQYNSMFESPKRYTSAHCSMETIMAIAKECGFAYEPYCKKFLLEEAGSVYVIIALRIVSDANPEVSDDLAYHICELYEGSLEFKELSQYFLTKKERLEKSGCPVVSKEELLREINAQISRDIDKISLRFP